MQQKFELLHPLYTGGKDVFFFFFLLKQGGAEHWGSKLPRGFHSKEFFLHTPRKAERLAVYRTLVKVRSSAQ